MQPVTVAFKPCKITIKKPTAMQGRKPDLHGCVHFGLQTTAFKHSISVRSVFTYCAIIANQSYAKDFLNSAFKAQILNFQTFDKVNDDSFQKCLLLYFVLKNKHLSKKTGFARTFQCLILVHVDFWDINRSNMVGILKVM